MGAKIRWEVHGSSGFAGNEDNDTSNFKATEGEQVYIKVFSNKLEANGTYISVIEKKEQINIFQQDSHLSC